MIFLEWVRRIWYLVNRQRLERELQQEMDAHREMMQEPARFGNTLRLREESREFVSQLVRGDQGTAST